MKIKILLLLMFLSSACGQTGPLYLPDNPPPIYVPEEDQ